MGALDKLACLPETTFIFSIGWYRGACDVMWSGVGVGVRIPDPFFLVHIMTWLLRVELSRIESKETGLVAFLFNCRNLGWLACLACL